MNEVAPEVSGYNRKYQTRLKMFDKYKCLRLFWRNVDDEAKKLKPATKQSKLYFRLKIKQSFYLSIMILSINAIIHLKTSIFYIKNVNLVINRKLLQ
jgi:hypothetical protein